MDIPLPSNAQIEAAKAIGAVVASKQGSAHAFVGLFAISLLQASGCVDLTRPLPSLSELSGHPLMLLADYYTNATGPMQLLGAGFDPVTHYNPDDDFQVTVHLVDASTDPRLTLHLPDNCTSPTDLTILFRHRHRLLPASGTSSEASTVGTIPGEEIVQINHTTVDYENSLSTPRYPAHLALGNQAQSILHIPVTGGVTIPILHPSLLAPHLIYNIRTTTYYLKPNSPDVIRGIYHLLGWLVRNGNQKIRLDRYVSPRRSGWPVASVYVPMPVPPNNAGNGNGQVMDELEWVYHPVQYKYRLMIAEMLRLRNTWAQIYRTVPATDLAQRQRLFILIRLLNRVMGA